MGGEVLKTDIHIIEQVLSGDKKAYSEIVKRYQKPILRMTMRFVKDLDVAQDVVQETFIKAYEKLGSFEGRSAFKSWIYQIAINTAKNKIRDARHEMMDLENVNLAIEAEAETSLIQNAISGQLQKEVEKLPFKQKTALILRVYDDLSFKEIAEIMDCPYDTAKANYRHALLKLKENIEGSKELKNYRSSVMGFFTEVQEAEV